MEYGQAKFLLLVLISVLINGWSCCYGCLEHERIGLLQLKDSINYPDGQSLPSWGDLNSTEVETIDCCKWTEVRCNSTTGHVIKLSLNFTRMLGDWMLDASKFLPFSELRILQLPYNNIVGWSENEGFERQSRWSNLEELDLSGNNLNSTILSSLSGLLSLKYLNLASNSLEGSIHVQDLTNLISLKELDLSYNSIRSFIPKKGSQRLPGSSNLEVLNLYSNLCDNTILASLGGHSSIKNINLRNNKLKGSVHIQALAALRNLEELDISSNDVHDFIIPEDNVSQLKVLYLNNVTFNASNLLQSFKAFSVLKTLSFQNGKFEGTIPPHEKFNHRSLEELIMDYTLLDKDFLQRIGGMASLKVLSLFGCGLKGTLPIQGWCDLKNLEELDISENELEGMLPSCLGNLTSLRVMDLSSNRFTGNISSSSLPALTLLEYLYFSNNNFQVPVSFRSFANFSNLKIIIGDSNKLVEDSMFQTWVPKFQLKQFSLSNCTSNKLHPEIPNFLLYQNDLRILDLSRNYLRGNFPSWLLENNTRLQQLNLRDNNFTGFFQTPSHPNPNISLIDISENHVSGQIPANMGSVFPNLRILNMSRNELEGNIPFSFGNMKFLWALDLSNNHLKGNIPEQLATGCFSLIFLKLSNNKFEGHIFPHVVNFTNLECLYLDRNNFFGGIPNSLSNISLLVLDISFNNLSGELPRWIGDMSNTKEIAISGNNIQGSIPVEFCKLDNLLFLDLSINNLSGSIPSCFNPPNIKHVHLFKNRLTGRMTRAFSRSSLMTLDLRDNNLSGRIPKWIGTLSELSILLLSSNQFKGKIPNQLCQLKRLRLMDLSKNNLSESIPSCLRNITFEMVTEKYLLSAECIGGPPTQEGLFSYEERKKLKDMERDMNIEKYPLLDVQQQVEFTTKSKSYTYKDDILRFMSGIDLSCNKLSGNIPPELGSLSEVRAVNLSLNYLHGSIPTTFSGLRKIESLDLSYNNLSGRIPSQLIQLNYLAVFRVAYNNLSGETPVQKDQFGTFEASSYEGNPLLCGPPLKHRCSEPEIPLSPMPNFSDSEKENGDVDMGVFYVSFTVSYISLLLGSAVILYINPYWRRAWFYIVEECMYSSYYFVVDIFRKFFKYRNV